VTTEDKWQERLPPTQVPSIYKTNADLVQAERVLYIFRCNQFKQNN